MLTNKPAAGAIDPAIKAHQLRRLFRYADFYNTCMLLPFIVNGLPTYNLQALPEPDRKIWFELKPKSDRVTRLITKVVNEKGGAAI